MLTTIGALGQAGGRCYLSVCRLSSSKQAPSGFVEGELQRIVGLLELLIPDYTMGVRQFPVTTA